VSTPEQRLVERIEVVGPEECRIDKYICDTLKLFTRSQIKNRNVKVKVNGREVKLSRKVTEGDTVEVSYDPPISIDIEPEKVDLDIIFENGDVIVLNKPQGVVVHPAPGSYHGTLVQGLMFYLENLSSRFPGEPVRPGVVHRLDKDTSGVIIAAKHPEALEFLSRQFREKTTVKKYIAVVKGQVDRPSGRIETFIARDSRDRKKFAVYENSGKRAVTEFFTLKRFGNMSLVLLVPHTGRTHQLRVHMSSAGHPIAGDPVYGRMSGSFRNFTLMLHALTLEIVLPGENVPRKFTAPVPERFLKISEVRQWFTDYQESL